MLEPGGIFGEMPGSIFIVLNILYFFFQLCAISFLTFTQLNSNIANATETINNSYIYIVTQTLNFSAGKANYSRNLSSVFSNVRFATVMARASDHVIGCSLTNGDILNYTILMSNLSSQQFNGNIQVQIMYIGEKV